MLPARGVKEFSMLKQLLIATAAVAALQSQAQALSLAPGDIVRYTDMSGTAVAGNQDFSNPIAAGDVAFDRTEGGFVAGETVDDLEYIRARIAQTIYRTPGTNELTFVNQLIFDQLQAVGGPGGIAGGYSLSGFAGFDLDVDFNSDLSTAGFDVSRSADGDVLTFGVATIVIDFDGPVLIVRTNAVAFNSSGMFSAPTLLGFGSEDISANGTFAPSPVPLPPALGLLASALAFFGFAVRRQKA
jgi:hypothetical protein